MFSLLYRWATRLVRRLAPRLSAPDSKLRRGVEGRAHAHERLVAWATSERDPERPVVWFHAPSVGEGFQAASVITALREARPEVQIVYTWFSPSAERWVERVGADVATYLPWDLRETVGAALDALRPDALVFTKTEVWPVAAAEAAARRIPIGIVGASVPPDAGRAAWPARSLLRSTWERLAVACANSEADAAGLRALGVDPSVVHVTGDPGIDSAVRRAAGADPEAPHLAPFHADPRPTLVAGSTWPSGEAVLLPALDRVRAVVPDLRLVIAPHEPTPEHVDVVSEELSARAWRVTTLSALLERGGRSPEDREGLRSSAIVVDSVGLLAELYSVATVAYVGGGFHAAGLHSVLEPAAMGVPVVFGPKYANARAAADLRRLNGAKVAADTRSMERVLTDWLTNDAEREAAGAVARDYIDEHRGAAERSAALLETLVRQRSGTPSA